MEPNKLDERLSRLYAAPVPESYENGWRADIRREESIRRMNEKSWKPMWKRMVPALCALVLVAGGLWTGTLEKDSVPQENGAVVMTRSASGAAPKLAANYSLMEEEAAYDSVASYDMGVTTYGANIETDRKLVRSADLTIRTRTFDAALEQVQKTLDEMSGFIENLHQYGDETRHISLSMRVPSEKLDDFLQSMEGAGRVTSRGESTTDMTTQYVDNEVRLQTLYEKRDRLNELLAKAETVGDLIEIESAIADTQYQIDSFETSQRSIDRQVDMSSVYLTLQEEEQTVVNPELSLAERIAAGFSDSIEWLTGFARDVVVFVVMASPVIGAALTAWLIYLGIRRIRKGRNE